MLKTQRQEEIVREVWQRGTVAVADLAARLGVSVITVRRDLDELGRSGRLQRIHGGARRASPREPEPPVVQRQAAQAAEKRAIGLAAARLVQDGSVIGIESGSTSLELARALALGSWRSLHVITNSFLVVNQLAQIPGVQLVFLGGSVNPDEMGTFGSMAEEALRRINIDRLFMTCRGIDPQAGLSNDAAAEGTFATERALVRASRQVTVLADRTKFGRVFPLQSVPIADIHTVITDSQTPEGLLQQLREQGVQVIVAPVPGVASNTRCPTGGNP
jgi:DeoR/GlpR family transcriptional regulator of sugar metabolism